MVVSQRHSYMSKGVLFYGTWITLVQRPRTIPANSSGSRIEMHVTPYIHSSIEWNGSMLPTYVSSYSYAKLKCLLHYCRPKSPHFNWECASTLEFSKNHMKRNLMHISAVYHTIDFRHRCIVLQVARWQVGMCCVCSSKPLCILKHFVSAVAHNDVYSIRFWTTLLCLLEVQTRLFRRWNYWRWRKDQSQLHERIWWLTPRAWYWWLKSWQLPR